MTIGTFQSFLDDLMNGSFVSRYVTRTHTRTVIGSKTQRINPRLKVHKE